MTSKHSHLSSLLLQYFFDHILPSLTFPPCTIWWKKDMEKATACSVFLTLPNNCGCSESCSDPYTCHNRDMQVKAVTENFYKLSYLLLLDVGPTKYMDKWASSLFQTSPIKSQDTASIWKRNCIENHGKRKRKSIFPMGWIP